MRTANLLLLFVTIISVNLAGCKKDSSLKEKKEPKPATENLPPTKFSISVEQISGDTAKIKWTNALDPEKKKVVYALYLNDQLQISNLSDTTFTFKNLKELTDYNVRIIATDPENNQAFNQAHFTTTKYWLKFIKRYRYKNKGSACSGLVKANDGGYILAGRTGVYTTREFFAIKIDTIGNVIWEKSLGNIIDDAPLTKLISSGDGYLFCTDKHIIKFDNNGDLVWDVVPNIIYKINGICIDLNKNIYIAGIEYPDGIRGQGFGSLQVLDQNGKLIWNKNFAAGYPDEFHDVCYTSDGNLAVVNVMTTNPYPTFTVLKMDLKTKSVLWFKILNTIYGFNGRIIETTNGDLLISGYYLELSSPSVFLQMLDKNGNLKWKFLGGNNYYGWPRGAIEGHNQSLIVFGAAMFSAYFQDFGLYKFDYYGMLQWQKTYSEDYLTLQNEGVIPTPDGGYLIAASKSDKYGYGGYLGEICVFKSDDKGSFN